MFIDRLAVPSSCFLLHAPCFLRSCSSCCVRVVPACLSFSIFVFFGFFGFYVFVFLCLRLHLLHARLSSSSSCSAFFVFVFVLSLSCEFCRHFYCWKLASTLQSSLSRPIRQAHASTRRISRTTNGCCPCTRQWSPMKRRLRRRCRSHRVERPGEIRCAAIHTTRRPTVRAVLVVMACALMLISSRIT